MLLVMLAGCNRAMTKGGPYAEAKRTWDTPPSAETESKLRNRVITSQRDS